MKSRLPCGKAKDSERLGGRLPEEYVKKIENLKHTIIRLDKKETVKITTKSADYRTFIAAFGCHGHSVGDAFVVIYGNGWAAPVTTASAIELVSPNASDAYKSFSIKNNAGFIHMLVLSIEDITYEVTNNA